MYPLPPDHARSSAPFTPGPEDECAFRGQGQHEEARQARRQAVERRRTARDLRQAVDGGEFSLCLQPRCILGDGRLTGAEASIRWPRRKLGLAPAGSLVPLLERCGLMLQTTAWMMESACREALPWEHPPLSVALDVPGGMLVDGSLIAVVSDALHLSGLPPGRLDLELPESELAEAGEDALVTLCALRDLGVGLVLDHFGSLSASLLTLKRLPLTMLKIDRSLVRDLPQDQAAAATIEAAAGMARRFDMSVVALGVDTPEQREMLGRLGCLEGQGAVFGGAMAPEAFAAMLQEQLMAEAARPA